MLGQMQDHPLLISGLIAHAARDHATTEIVSRTCEGPILRTDWAGVALRAKRIAQALLRLGVQPGDRVATLAWNTHRHLELYFAVSGIGAVLHTVNPRLFPEQISYILNHAGSSVLCFDIPLTPLVEGLRPNLGAVERLIAMTDADHMPDLPGCLCYESLLGAEDGQLDWPRLDENTASSLCYTSGTTGNPKGVLYSHRSTVLHSMMACTMDGLQLSSRDSVMPVVPMFHVNAWGIPYASALSGARLVLPGPKLDGESLWDLMVAERVSFSLGVPTVWLGVFGHIDRTPDLDLAALRLGRVVIGGSAAPRAMIDRFARMGVFVVHAWGMTETSPLGSVCNLLPKHDALDDRARGDIQESQGRALFGIEPRIVDDEGAALPHDGKAAGHLQVRGPWVTAGYFGADGPGPVDAAGWFTTGDVARINGDGYIQITDRAKDVIKSGGEWISSIDLENAAVAHPDVAEAAVIGVPHPKWQERPLLVVVRKPGANPDPAALRAFLADRVARWWLPDAVEFVDELPHTATGKIQKLTLRAQFRDYRLPAVF